MPLSEARKKANRKWNDKNLKNVYDRIQLVMPKGKKIAIQKAKEQTGMSSVNEFINMALDKELDRLSIEYPKFKSDAGK